MTDLERIRKIEEHLGFKLKQVPFEEVGRKDLIYNMGARNFSCDATGKLTGLSLDYCISLQDPCIIDLLSEFRGIRVLSLRRTLISDYLFLLSMKELTSLDLWDNDLTDVSFVKHLKSLTSLNLGDNKLTDVSSLKELKGLASLNLGSNKLMDVSFLKELKGLASLELWDNNLTDVSFLKELEELTSLTLHSNNLTNVSFLKELKGLTSLKLGNNKLTDVSFLKELKGLSSLELWDNNLADVSFLKELKELSSLKLWSNNLTDVSFLKELKKLTSLTLGGIKLTDVSFLKELKKLASLRLGCIKLTDVSFIKEMKGLTSLSLGYNRLLDVSFLKELTRLTLLDLEGNYLTDVSFLKDMKELVSLDLNDNQLIDVSPLKKLKKLTWLKLSNNQLLDVSFAKDLKGLSSLDLSNNSITEIPEWLARKGIDISMENHFPDGIALFENPIETPPLEIVQQGNDAIINYYRQLKSQGTDFLYEAKLLIVGEGESGKTTLAHKIKNPDCPLPHIDDRTKGITITPHLFDTSPKDGSGQREFRLNVWDFGGQEMYHATHRFFLSKRSLYVLVADNRKDDTDFNYWLNIIELFAGECAILIVLNEKGDVQRAINIAELKGRFPKSIKEIVSVNFKTCEGEDTTKREQRLKRIGELKSHIEHYAANLPQIGEPLPARWIEIRQSIESDNRDVINRVQFNKLCSDKGLMDERDIDTLLGYFHDLGVVLHFGGCPRLRDWVILKPFWATAAVYRIFDDDGIKAMQGRFSRNDCAALWTEDKYREHCDMLVELMKNFHLVYEIESSGNLVAPQILPKDTPHYDWPSIDKSRMEFRYDKFMPKGILWQFIVMMYRYIEDHRLVWRNGVILKRGGARAAVTESIQDRRIYIRFTGPDFIELRAIITDALGVINDTYHGLKCEAMIPCNCDECKDGNDPAYFEYSDLTNRRDKGKSTIECKKSFADVQVLPLLEGFDSPRLKEELREATSPSFQIKTIRIFLASSSELAEDRKEFEILINRENKKLNEKGIFLRLEIWEDFIDSMSQTALQDEYKKMITQCDLFVMLYFTKVGKYTKQEFETAFGSFKEANRPRIYTYFKDANITTGKLNRADVDSLLSFQELLGKLGHFQKNYTDINDLKYQFSGQLEKVLPTLV